MVPYILGNQEKGKSWQHETVYATKGKVYKKEMLVSAKNWAHWAKVSYFFKHLFNLHEILLRIVLCFRVSLAIYQKKNEIK